MKMLPFKVLEQLEDAWHVANGVDNPKIGAGTVCDDNGLAVLPEQIIRCKVERDNLKKVLEGLLRISNERHEAWKVIEDIRDHEDGL